MGDWAGGCAAPQEGGSGRLGAGAGNGRAAAGPVGVTLGGKGKEADGEGRRRDGMCRASARVPVALSPPGPAPPEHRGVRISSLSRTTHSEPLAPPPPASSSSCFEFCCRCLRLSPRLTCGLWFCLSLTLPFGLAALRDLAVHCLPGSARPRCPPRGPPAAWWGLLPPAPWAGLGWGNPGGVRQTPPRSPGQAAIALSTMLSLLLSLETAFCNPST